MKKVYGICSGEYSDWHIDYMFESEEKRDKLLKILNCNYKSYSKINFDLDDKKFDASENYLSYYIYYKKNSITNDESFEFKIINNNTIETSKKYIKSYNYTKKLENLIIIEMQNILPNKTITINERQKLKNKYLKVCRDYYAKAEYMRKINGLNEHQISETLFK